MRERERERRDTDRDGDGLLKTNMRDNRFNGVRRSVYLEM